MTKKMGFSAADICVMIKTAKECGVNQLRVGELKVFFLPPKPKAGEVATPTPEQIREIEQAQNEDLSKNERMLRDEELSQLRLADPEAYEDLIARGELENAREKSEGTFT